MASTTDMIAPLDGASLYKEETKTAGDSRLDKDAFLNLLVAQMKYQNPLEPMSNTESIAQLAQFSALEQMTNVVLGQQEASAYSLIGKYVMGNLYNDSTGVSETIYGTVSSVKKNGSDMFLIIDGQELPLKNVTNVTDTNSGTLGAINSNIATSQSLTLIGKNIQAVILDEQGNLSKFVEGTVDYVKVSNGRTVLMVNDMEVFAEEVMLVSDEKKLLNTSEVTGYVTNSDGSLSKDEEGNLISVTGKITGIEFKENEPYLVIEDKNGGGTKKILIGTISDITEGINLLGKNVDTKNVKGTVTGVAVKSGVVYLTVGSEEVKLETVKNAMMGTETEETEAEAATEE